MDTDPTLERRWRLCSVAHLATAESVARRPRTSQLALVELLGAVGAAYPRPGRIIDAISRVLSDERNPMQARDVHARVETLLDEPVRWATVKATRALPAEPEQLRSAGTAGADGGLEELGWRGFPSSARWPACRGLVPPRHGSPRDLTCATAQRQLSRWWRRGRRVRMRL